MAVDSARFGGLFAVKSADAHLDHVRREGRLRRAIGLFDLTALGLGAVIGTGIFVILGEAIGDSGPAIVLSFVLAAVTCASSALSYSELASSIRSPAARTPTRTPPSVSCWPGSSAGISSSSMAAAIFGILIAVLAATVPLEIIFELVKIDTLFAFVIVDIGVIVLRRTRPYLERGFRVPGVPVVPIIGALLCFYLMKQLTIQTWLRFIVWLLVGLVIYFLYGRRHSRLQHGETVVTEES